MAVGVGGRCLGHKVWSVTGSHRVFETPARTYIRRTEGVTVERFDMAPHAVQRALDMGVEGEEIRAAMHSPDRIYWSSAHDAWTYQSGRIALGVRGEENARVVVTVLWATDEAWVADAMTAPLMEGRELRGVARAIAARNGVPK